MGFESECKDSTDRRNWDKIFKTLVMILQTKQDQLESLVKDMKLIEVRFKNQHENWVTDVRNYEEQLSLMGKEIETMRKMQFMETAKCDLLSGFKETDLSLCNLKLEQAMEELTDFKAWFDLLTLNTNKESGTSEAADDAKSSEAELRKLKLEFSKLASEKKLEVSELLRENGFAWSQFKCVESGLGDKLKKKDDEIAKANTKISSLLSYQEELQSSKHEKDEIISRLKAEMAEMEKNSVKKDEEISKLSRDLESLKKSRSFTPVLTRCTARDKGIIVGGSHTTTKKEKSVASTSNQQVIESSKRKRVNKTPVSVPEIPKLFTSNFRIPKLKSPSSGAI